MSLLSRRQKEQLKTPHPTSPPAALACIKRTLRDTPPPHHSQSRLRRLLRKARPPAGEMQKGLHPNSPTTFRPLTALGTYAHLMDGPYGRPHVPILQRNSSHSRALDRMTIHFNSLQRPFQKHDAKPRNLSRRTRPIAK